MLLNFKNIQEFILYGSISLVLLSCQKEIEYDLPQSDPKFILDAYVFPSPHFRGRDSSLYKDKSPLYVGRSTSIFSKDGPQLIDAGSLRLYENNVEIDSAIKFLGIFPPLFEYYDQPNYYLEHRFEPGSHYRLEVKNKELGLAWSEFVMPDSIPLLGAEWDTLTGRVRFTFKDPSGPDHYYFRIESRDTSSYFQPIICFEVTDPSISIFRKREYDSLLIYSPTSLGYYGCSGFFNDKGFDGKIKTIEVKLQKFYEGQLAEVKPVLYHITKAMYEHERTLAAYTETKDNPFAEKVKIHNNIQNGFGIFAGATPSTMVATKK